MTTLKQFLTTCPYAVDTSRDARPADRLHHWAAQFAWKYYWGNGEASELVEDDETRRRVMLDHAVDLLRCSEELMRQTVAAARDMGATWDEIGGALGIAKQVAQQRYS